jgi:hypothetical protein
VRVFFSRGRKKNQVRYSIFFFIFRYSNRSLIFRFGRRVYRSSEFAELYMWKQRLYNQEQRIAKEQHATPQHTILTDDASSRLALLKAETELTREQKELTREKVRLQEVQNEAARLSIIP